jgi:predicted kinase
MEAIFLSGPSGVGKTTVSRALIRRLTEPWLFFEVDKCQPTLPDRPEVATIEIDRAMVAANIGAVRSYVDSGFRVLAEMDVADDFSRTTVRQLLGKRARTIVLTCSTETAVNRASTRSAGVSMDFVRRHTLSRSWNDVEVDRIEPTDGRDLEEVVEAVRSWIEDRPVAQP